MPRARRRQAIGEIVSAAIILAAASVAATIMLSAFSESANVAWDDTRSRLDIMRAQAVEQLDVTSRSCCPGGNMTWLVVNYGDYPTTLPFGMYRGNGTEVTNANVNYFTLNNTLLASCTATNPCDPHETELPSKGAVRMEMPWTGPADPLLIVSDSGKALWVIGR